jgi:hypothetical protein
LNSKTYQSICRRIQLEETNSALSEPSSTGAGAAASSVINSATMSGVASQAVSNAQAKVFAFFK